MPSHRVTIVGLPLSYRPPTHTVTLSLLKDFPHRVWKVLGLLSCFLYNRVLTRMRYTVLLYTHHSFPCRPARYFYIRSEMHGQCVTVRNACPDPDTEIVMWDKEEGEDHQLWYEDKYGVIRSKLTDFVLDSSSKSRFKLSILLLYSPLQTNRETRSKSTKFVHDDDVTTHMT